MLKRVGSKRSLIPKGIIPARRLDPSEVGTLEDKVIGLAMRGKLAKAGRRAAAAQRQMGLPVTLKRGQKVIKVYPDGREETLAELPRPIYALPKGVRVIR